jgi:hypothetical protein
VQFLGPFVVAPVADPDQVAAVVAATVARAGVVVGAWPEHAGVRRLVPGPRPRRPALAQVDRAEHLPEGQHAVVLREVVGRHGGRIGDGTVVGVVEQQPEAAAGAAPTPDGGHELRLVPLVDQHQIDAVEHGVERDGEAGGVVADAGEARVGAGEAGERLRAVVRDQVVAAPAVAGLVHRHPRTPCLQLGGDAAQEVGVAVVPVRHEGVVEERDPQRAHARTRFFTRSS